MDNIFQTVSYERLINIFFEANEYILMASPGIFNEYSEALSELKDSRPDIEIELLIDPSEDGFRKHYGDAEAIHKLKEKGITICEFKNHRLGFIITDHTSLLIFNQSRAIEKNVHGYNAIKMSLTMEKAILMHCYGKDEGFKIDDNFGEQLKEELSQLEKTKIDVSEKGGTDFTPDDLNEEEFKEVSENLKKNPPPSPDFKRLINVYSTKIKFVDFSVRGIKITNKTVRIPSSILQLVDEDLRKQITTRIRIFNPGIKREVEKLTNPIQQRAEDLRNKYFCRISSRNKNVIKASQQRAFKKAVDDLKSNYQSIQQEIHSLLYEAIEDVEDRLKKELTKIIEENPSDFIYKGAVDNVGLFAKSKAKELVKDLDIPSLEKLASSFKIEYHFFDPTIEDLRNEEFIKELFQHGFITEQEKYNIVDESKAIGVQPTE